MMMAKGKYRKSKAAKVARRKPSEAEFLEGIERSQPFGNDEIDRHDGDGHDGKGRRERNVARCALMRVDRHADKETRVTDNLRDDVIAQCERESEDGTGHHAGERQRQNDVAEGLARARA